DRDGPTPGTGTRSTCPPRAHEGCVPHRGHVAHATSLARNAEEVPPEKPHQCRSTRMADGCPTIRNSDAEESQLHHDTPGRHPSRRPRRSTFVAALDIVDSDMGPLMTHSADLPSTTVQASREGSDLEVRPLSMEEGAAMWRIARDSGTL